MKKQLPYTILLCSIICLLLTNDIYSQTRINWSEFQEPDGKLTYVRVNPNADFRGSRYLRLNSSYLSRKLNNLSIFNSFLRLNYQNNKSDSDEVNNLISFNPEISYIKYINQRRGFFIEPIIDIYYRKYIDSDIDDYIRSTNSIGIGFGRIEEISTVNQAMRILNNIDILSPLFNVNSQDEIFSLASKLRQLDYHFERDQRIRDLTRIEMFLDYFRDRFIDLNNTSTTAQLIDGYLNSRVSPFFGGWSLGRSYDPLQLEGLIQNLPDDPIGEFKYGQKASLSIEHWSDGEANVDNLNATSLKVDLMKSFAISNSIRTNIYGLTNYFINSPDISFAYRFGVSGYYTPDARTNIGLSFLYKGVANEIESFKYLQINLRASYFFSYNTVLTAWFRYYGTDEFISRNNNFNISLNHYFY